MGSRSGNIHIVSLHRSFDSMRLSPLCQGSDVRPGVLGLRRSGFFVAGTGLGALQDALACLGLRRSAVAFAWQARTWCSPTTNHQPPTATNHQPPTTNQPPPTTNHQLPAPVSPVLIFLLVAYFCGRVFFSRCLVPSDVFSCAACLSFLFCHFR